MAMIEWGQKSTPPLQKKKIPRASDKPPLLPPPKKTPCTKMPNSQALKISRKHEIITRKIKYQNLNILNNMHLRHPRTSSVSAIT